MSWAPTMVGSLGVRRGDIPVHTSTPLPPMGDTLIGSKRGSQSRYPGWVTLDPLETPVLEALNQGLSRDAKGAKSAKNVSGNGALLERFAFHVFVIFTKTL